MEVPAKTHEKSEEDATKTYELMAHSICSLQRKRIAFIVTRRARTKIPRRTEVWHHI